VEPFSLTADQATTWVLGDTQRVESNRSANLAAIQAAAAQSTAALINVGDVAGDADIVESDWTKFVADLHGWGDPQWTGRAGRVPIVCAMGNHDTYGDLAMGLWEQYLPAQWAAWGAKTYGSYVTGHIRWLLLDVMHQSAEQTAWLVAQLDAATEPWIIPVWHIRTYPADNLGEEQDLGLKPGTLNWVQACEDSGRVRLVMHGHAHLYQRTHPMRLGVRSDSDGIIYITAAATAAPLSFGANPIRVTTIVNATIPRTDVADAANFLAYVQDPGALGALRVYATATTLGMYAYDIADLTTLIDSVELTA
jgi:hypothetical protein